MCHWKFLVNLLSGPSVILLIIFFPAFPSVLVRFNRHRTETSSSSSTGLPNLLPSVGYLLGIQAAMHDHGNISQWWWCL